MYRLPISSNSNSLKMQIYNQKWSNLIKNYIDCQFDRIQIHWKCKFIIRNDQKLSKLHQLSIFSNSNSLKNYKFLIKMNQNSINCRKFPQIHWIIKRPPALIYSNNQLPILIKLRINQIGIQLEKKNVPAAGLVITRRHPRRITYTLYTLTHTLTHTH